MTSDKKTARPFQKNFQRRSEKLTLIEIVHFWSISGPILWFSYDFCHLGVGGPEKRTRNVQKSSKKSKRDLKRIIVIISYSIKCSFSFAADDFYLKFDSLPIPVRVFKSFMLLIHPQPTKRWNFKIISKPGSGIWKLILQEFRTFLPAYFFLLTFLTPAWYLEEFKVLT